MLKDFNPKYRWNTPYGYKNFLKICLPLIMSSSSASIMLLTDRIFLGRYSSDAIAASLPAGVASLTVSSLFMGIVGCVSTLVAQYTGARQPKRAGAVLWQGVYFSLAAGIFLALFYFAAPYMFAWANHPPAVLELELIYFRILIVCSIFNLLAFNLACFLSGLGYTRIIMWISLIGAALNIPLDYLLIYGFSLFGFNFPRLGVTGAALATVSSWLFMLAAYGILIFNRRWEKTHGIFSQRAPDSELMKRLIKYGLPGGFQFLAEIAGFTYFNIAVGRLEELIMATNNIVFSIESQAFFPLLGIGQSVSIMVGQAIGRGAPQDGAEAAKSGIGLSSVYLFLICALFLIFPHQLISLFVSDNYRPDQLAVIYEVGRTLLRFVVVYCLFDGLYLCCFGAIRGAGDVYFPMCAMILAGIFMLVLPLEAVHRLGYNNIYYYWAVMVAYVLFLTAAGVWRYRQGKWRTKRMIEAPLPESAPA